MAGTRSPNLTSMTQVQDLRCSWQFLLLSRGHKLFDGSASDPAAVTVPPPPLLALLHAPSYHCSDPCLELDPTPLLSLMCAHDSWRENWSATRRLGKLEETQSFWEKISFFSLFQHFWQSRQWYYLLEIIILKANIWQLPRFKNKTLYNFCTKQSIPTTISGVQLLSWHVDLKVLAGAVSITSNRILWVLWSLRYVPDLLKQSKPTQ